MRFERKYRIPYLSFEEADAVLRRHELAFLPAYPDRWINTLYLDTPDLEGLRNRMNGAEKQVLFRLRWYGGNWMEAKTPLLETKISMGDLVEKNKRSLPSFRIHSRYDIAEFARLHISTPDQLRPVMLSRFHRRYYQAAGGEFRLTLDHQIEYRTVRPGFFSELNFATDPELTLEVKYEEAHDDAWTFIDYRFPFRSGRFSKYVNGMLLTGLAE